MYYFRLLEGKHVGPGPDGCTCENCEYNRSLKDPAAPRRGHVYRPGDMIGSTTDLGIFNSVLSQKFDRIDAAGRSLGQVARQRPGVPAASSPAIPEALNIERDLKALTVDELRALAQSEEIDLGSATRKEDIINAIKTATQPSY